MTIEKLLRDLGAVSAAYQRETLINLPCKRIQADEIWSFCYSKAKNAPADKQGVFGYGDVWTWTAIAPTRSCACPVSSRRAAYEFMSDVAARLRNRIQLTTDGHIAYLSEVEDAFGGHIDSAMLTKIHGVDPNAERRYSPPVCLGCESKIVSGDPAPKYILNSYVERQNFTMRMHNHHFTRLMNAFSKKSRITSTQSPCTSCATTS
jgi:hypothetical protein